MDPKSAIALAVQISLILIVASAALRSSWSDLGWGFRHPGRLVRGLVAVNLVVPLVAVVVVMALPIPPAVRFGLVVMAVSPLAPLVPGKMLKAGAGSSVAVGLYFALILLAVLIVPATIALLGAVFDIELVVPVGELARFVFVSVLLPLAGGLVIASLAPALAPRLATVAAIVGYLLLLPVLAGVLYVAGGAMMALVGDGTVAAIVVTVAAALAAGHLLGGPEMANRMALAQAAATRHPGIAALVAHHYSDDRRIMLAIVLFLLVSVGVSAVYQAWAKRRLSAENSDPDPAI